MKWGERKWKKISGGIVFSNDIKIILNGINAFDFKYDFISSGIVIENLREDFKRDVNEIFKNDVIIIDEDEMMEVKKLIGGEYPHCFIG